MVGGDIELRCAVPVRMLHAALEHRQDVVGPHRHGKAQQRRPWMAQAADLAVQHRLQPLKHPLDAPALTVQLGDLLRAHLAGQIAPQPDHRVACLGGDNQAQLDTPPGRLALIHPDRLLTHFTRLHARARQPRALLDQPGMPGMLAHDEASLRVAPALHEGVGAEVAICDPKLTRLSTGQQGGNRRALLGMRVLAGHDVRHQCAVRVVDQQRVAG